MARCIATTKAGNQCKNQAQDGSQTCYMHRAQETEATVTAVAANEDQTQESPVSASDDAFARKRAELMGELDQLLAELQTAVPATTDSPYSPLRFARFLRDNFDQMRPELQLGVLENFQDMTLDDWKDIDTWKGLLYMMSHSARFQAEQLKEKMNEQLPKPLQPDTVIDFVKKNIDRFTPDVAKNIISTFEDATREDLMDPDTWKGVWYMLNYSLQFQATQLKEKLLGADEAEENAA